MGNRKESGERMEGKERKEDWKDGRMDEWMNGWMEVEHAGLSRLSGVRPRIGLACWERKDGKEGWMIVWVEGCNFEL